MRSTMFLKCSTCGHQWESREDFISDPLVKLIGYQVNFEDLQSGFFMFNHLAETCRTTISLRTGLFSDLYHGEIFRERLTGSSECPGYCLYRNNLQSCPARCDCNFIRGVMQAILKYPKMAA